MKSEAKLQILKAGGHTMGRWRGAPVKSTKTEAHQTIENNEEEPMLPVIMDDPKKPSADDSGPEILMPTSI